MIIYAKTFLKLIKANPWAAIMIAIIVISPFAVIIGNNLAKKSTHSTADLTSQEVDVILNKVMLNNPANLINTINNNIEKRNTLIKPPQLNSQENIARKPNQSPTTKKKKSNQPTPTPLVSLTQPKIKTPTHNNGLPISSFGTNPSVPVPRINSQGPVGGFISGSLAIPNIKETNYRYTKSILHEGVASKTCPSEFDAQVPVLISEYYEYFDEHHSFYKDVTTNEQNQLFSYELSKYGNDVSEYYSYRDGDFAAKTIFEIDENYTNYYAKTPTSYPVTPITSMDWKDYFGDNIKITGVDVINGETYYQIDTVYETTCDYSVNTLTDVMYTDIIYRYTIRDSDFEIIQIQLFKDFVDPTNLIYTWEIDIQQKLITPQDIQTIFQFDKTQTIRTVNYRDYIYDPQAEYEKLIDYLTIKKPIIAIVEGSQIPENSAYYYGRDFPKRVVNEEYYFNRSFYPDTPLGNYLYDNMNTQYLNTPIFSTSYTSTGNNNFVQLSSYQEDFLDDSQNMSLIKPSIQDITLNINGQPRTLSEERRSYSYSFPVDIPISFPSSYPVSYAYSPISYPISYPKIYQTITQDWRDDTLIYHFKEQGYNLTMQFYTWGPSNNTEVEKIRQTTFKAIPLDPMQQSTTIKAILKSINTFYWSSVF